MFSAKMKSNPFQIEFFLKLQVFIVLGENKTPVRNHKTVIFGSELIYNIIENHFFDL